MYIVYTYARVISLYLLGICRDNHDPFLGSELVDGGPYAIGPIVRSFSPCKVFLVKPTWGFPWGYPNSWLLYKGKSQSKIDENWGYPPILGNILNLGNLQTRDFPTTSIFGGSVGVLILTPEKQPSGKVAPSRKL